MSRITTWIGIPILAAAMILVADTPQAKAQGFSLSIGTGGFGPGIGYGVNRGYGSNRGIGVGSYNSFHRGYGGGFNRGIGYGAVSPIYSPGFRYSSGFRGGYVAPPNYGRGGYGGYRGYCPY